MTKPLKNLAAKLVIGFTLIASPTLCDAGAIPVIDLPNLAQNIVSTENSVSELIKQIAQYNTQLQQYENQLLNTTNPQSFSWNQANNTINQLLGSLNSVNALQNQAGGLNQYLSQYQNTQYYQNSPCFNGNGCTQAQLQSIMANQAQSSAIQKSANDALLQNLSQGQANLQYDSNQLQILQQNAQSAGGQMQALQSANQLASASTNQLMQIHSLLIAEQTATATARQAEIDKQAKQDASEAQLTAGSFTPSPNNFW